MPHAKDMNRDPIGAYIENVVEPTIAQKQYEEFLAKQRRPVIKAKPITEMGRKVRLKKTPIKKEK